MRPAVARPTPLDDFSAVTDDSIAAPPAGDWLGWRRSYDAQGFSPLAEIDTRNVESLRLAWSWTMPAGSAEGVPLVRDGTIFVQAYGDVVQALDARTGDLLWQYTHTLEQGASPFHKRGLALSGNRLYLGTSDVHVVALDVTTGEVVWDTTVGDFRRREGLNGGPLVARGKVMVGTTGTGVAAKIGGPADRRAWRGNGRDRLAARHDRAARRARRRELERHSVRPAQRRLRLDAGQLRSQDGARLFRHGQHLRHGAAAPAERTGHHERRALHELDAGRES